MLGLHEVVARVQVAVVLQGQTRAAGLVEHAQPGSRRPEVVPDRRLEGLHVHAPDVVVDPLVPDRRQEPPELLGAHGSPRGRHPPHRVRVAVLVHALDDRDELHPVRAHLVAQEPVDLQRVVAIEPVDGGQDVVLDLVLLEQPQAAHDVIEGGLAALVDAVAVVERARPVDGDPDEVPVLGQERRPLRRRCASRWSGSCSRRSSPAGGTAPGARATRRKKSRPISVGSPPCQANVTRSVRCASISPRTYASSVASSMRNDEPGCIASLSRKKQYEQARLQIAPVGLAMTWKRGGAAGTDGDGRGRRGRDGVGHRGV